jgi:thioredoxin 1
MGKFNDIISGNTPVLVDFFATWCGPCQTMLPIIDDVKNDFGSDLRVLKVDVDKNIDVSQKYKIRGVPTLILFKGGEILWRGSGVHSRNDLKQIIKKALK